MAAGTPTLFLTALLCLGLCRGSRDEVQTGSPTKPSIWADPGPRVPQGGSVTIWCRGPPKASEFRLYHERDSEGEFMEESPAHSGQAYTSLQNLNVHRTGQYQCSYSSAHHPEERSDNLTLVLTGVFDPPSLLVQPSPLVQSGDSVTLRCSSQKFSIFALTKGDAPPHSLHGQPSPDFTLGPVSASHGGLYRCFGGHHLDFLWSEPSDPLDILVAGTGTGSSPELQALPELTVTVGGIVTLMCHSTDIADTFYLAQEGSATKPLQYLLPHPAAHSQANFTLQVMGPAQKVTYRCYNSNSSAPHLLSPPSKPLQLLISGKLDSLALLLGLSGALLGLLFLLLLFLFFWQHRHQAGHQKSNAAVTHTQSEEGTRLNAQVDINCEESQGVTYTQVNHAKHRQQAAPKDPQDVIYAELNHLASEGSQQLLPQQKSSPKTIVSTHLWPFTSTGPEGAWGP